MSSAPAGLTVIKPKKNQHVAKLPIVAHGLMPNPKSTIRGALASLSHLSFITGTPLPPSPDGKQWGLLFDGLLERIDYTLFVIDLLTWQAHEPISGIQFAPKDAKKGDVEITYPGMYECVGNTFPVGGSHSLAIGTTLKCVLTAKGVTGMGANYSQDNIGLIGRRTFAFWLVERPQDDYKLEVIPSEGAKDDSDPIFIWNALPDPCKSHAKKPDAGKP